MSFENDASPPSRLASMAHAFTFSRPSNNLFMHRHLRDAMSNHQIRWTPCGSARTQRQHGMHVWVCESCTVRSVDVYQEEEAVRPCTPPSFLPFSSSKNVLCAETKDFYYSRDGRSGHELRRGWALWLGARRVWPGSNGACRALASTRSRSVCIGGLYVVEIAAWVRVGRSCASCRNRRGREWRRSWAS